MPNPNGRIVQWGMMARRLLLLGFGPGSRYGYGIISAKPKYTIKLDGKQKRAITLAAKPKYRIDLGVSLIGE